MANIFTEQKLSDTHDKLIVKLTGKFDGSGEEQQMRVDVSNLNYALNTNGYIMSSNNDIKDLYRTSIISIIYDVNIANGYLSIQWAGSVGDETGNTDIVVLHSGQNSIALDETRYSTVIDNPIATLDPANTSGDIVFSTTGAEDKDSYTVFMIMKKDSRDYSKGQFADPYAFNKATAS